MIKNRRIGKRLRVSYGIRGRTYNGICWRWGKTGHSLVWTFSKLFGWNRQYSKYSFETKLYSFGFVLGRVVFVIDTSNSEKQP